LNNNKNTRLTRLFCKSLQKNNISADILKQKILDSYTKQTWMFHHSLLNIEGQHSSNAVQQHREWVSSGSSFQIFSKLIQLKT